MRSEMKFTLFISAAPGPTSLLNQPAYLRKPVAPYCRGATQSSLQPAGSCHSRRRHQHLAASLRRLNRSHLLLTPSQPLQPTPRTRRRARQRRIPTSRRRALTAAPAAESPRVAEGGGQPAPRRTDRDDASSVERRASGGGRLLVSEAADAGGEAAAARAAAKIGRRTPAHNCARVTSRL